MTGKQRMHNQVAPSEGVPRPDSAHVLNLTRWCLNSGSVQLPQVLLGRFQPGELTARSDGGELSLEFLAPRTLTGLGPFFEAHDLRVNDSIEFSFADGVLGITAHRDERRRGTGPASESRGRVGPVARGGADGPTASSGAGVVARQANWTEAVDQRLAAAAERQEPPQPAPNKGIVVDRFKGAIEELATDVADRAHGQEAEPEDPPPGPRGRSVTKVRIEGGVPANPALGPVRPKDRSSAHQVWARKESALWHSLDPLQEVDAADHERDPDYRDVRVRAFRRGANGSVRLEPFYLANEESQARPAATPRTERTSAPRRAQVREELPASSDAALPQKWPRSSATGAAERPRAASEPVAEGPRRTNLQGPEPVPAGTRGSERRPGGAGWASEREFESEAPIVVDDAEFEPTGHADWLADGEAAPTQARSPETRPQRRGVFDLRGLVSRLGRERQRGDVGRASSHSHGVTESVPGVPPLAPSPGRDPAPWAAPHGARALAETGPRPQPDARRGAGADPRRYAGGPEHVTPSGETWAPASATRNSAPANLPARPVASAVQEALLDAEALPSGPRRGELKPQDGEVGTRPSAPAPTASVDDDIAFLEGYLLRPDTPAIVRSIDLAEKLGMSPDRAARALDRLAEQRERFSKIKDGAYMVRQARNPRA